MIRKLCLGSFAFALVASAAPVQAGSNLDPLIAKHAAAHKLPESLVRRVIKRESGGNPRVIYHGNYGLMQIRLGTARAMGYRGSAEGLLDPDTNMTYAVKYLAGAYEVANGSADRAVHYYQAGYYYAAKHQRLHRTARAEPRIEPRAEPRKLATEAPKPGEARAQVSVEPRADPRKLVLAEPRPVRREMAMTEAHPLTPADKQLEPPTETSSIKVAEKPAETRVEARPDAHKTALAEPHPLAAADQQIAVPARISSIKTAEKPAEPLTQPGAEPRPDPRKLALAEPRPEKPVTKPAETQIKTAAAKPADKPAAVRSHPRAEPRNSESPTILKRLVSLLTSRDATPDKHKHARKLRRARAQAANAASSSSLYGGRPDLY